MSFSAVGGAQFSSSLTESTTAATNKGTIGSISSISGSVSCGTFTPGSASITVAGDTASGTLNGSLTMAHVLCGNNTAGGFVTVTGLSQLGSTPVLVSVFGGVGAQAFDVVLQTTSASYQYSSSAAGIVTRTSGGATYNGTAKETGSAGRMLTVSGSATCGT